MLLGGSRSDDLVYPDTAWYYYRFAKEFKWTPDQVDDLPAGLADYLIAIADTVEEVKAEKAEQATK